MSLSSNILLKFRGILQKLSGKQNWGYIQEKHEISTIKTILINVILILENNSSCNN